MSVKGILSKDEYEVLDASEQENFVNRDGSDLYFLDLSKEEADEIAGLQPLKDVTNKERKRAAQAEKQLKQFSNLGKTPDELLTMIELAQATALNAIAKANNSTLREIVVTLLNNNIELMLELQQQIGFIKEKRARELEKYAQRK